MVKMLKISKLLKRNLKSVYIIIFLHFIVFKSNIFIIIV